MADDFTADVTTTGVVAVDGTATGIIEADGDHDWFRVELTAGVMYALEQRGNSGPGTLFDPVLRLYDAAGTLLVMDDSSGMPPLSSRIIFTPTTTGTYYLDASYGLPAPLGSYTVAVISNYSLFSENDDHVRLVDAGQPSGLTWHALGGNDYVVGTTGNDTIHGDAGNDILFGWSGTDHLYGGEGNDGIVAADGNELIDGGTGNDVVYYHDFNEDSTPVAVILDDNGNGTATGHGTDTLVSIEGVHGTFSRTGDIIITGSASNYILGNLGGDYIDAGAGNDTIYGDYTDGDFATFTSDAIIAGDGDDEVHGGGTFFEVGAGNDDVILLDDYRNPLTSLGNDLGYGDSGNDLLWGYGGNDTIYGGTGDDALVGNDFGVAVTGIDQMFGGAGNDTLFVGIAGTASMSGDSGNDKLYGGPGADILADGLGSDYLFGGAGADTFVFDNYAFIGRETNDVDIIYFFDAAQGDKLKLHESAPASTLSMSNQIYNLPGLGDVAAVYMYNADGKWSALVYGVDVATLSANIVYF